MSDIKQKLLAAFDAEYRDHLALIRQVLELVTNSPDTPLAGSAPQVAEAFRRAHSLKGAARVVDLAHVTNLAHRLEALFTKIQVGQVPFNTAAAEVIAAALDAIEDEVGTGPGHPEPQQPEILLRIESLYDGKAALPPTQEPAAKPKLVEFPAAAVPSPQPVIAVPVSPPTPVKPMPAAVAGGSHETFRLSAAHFDRLMKTAGEVVGFSRNYEDHADHLKRMGGTVEGLEKDWAGLVKVLGKKLKTIRAQGDNDRLGMQLAQIESDLRLLGRQLRSAAGRNRNMNYSFRALGEQLQQEVQTARLVPALSFFESFPKMMRDLAKEAGKELDYRMHGADQEVDRVVMQSLKDPVMHILRNSLSHGIEAPEERIKAGKSRKGTVELKIELSARRLNLVISDDGAGLNLDKIKAKAIQAGVIAPAEAERLSREEITRLIFHDGLSTASELSEISGRGVGLSVVAETITRLNGEVEVLPGENGGTRFCLSVPLLLSTQRLLLVKCQDQMFALPIYAVQAVRRVKRDHVTMIEGHPTVVIDGKNVALVPLGQILGMPNCELLSTGEMLAFVLLKSGRRRLAVAVDDLVGEREGMVKNFGPPLNASHRFNGALASEKQQMALVVNTNSLFETLQRLKQAMPLVIAQRKQERRKLHILVVDDSFTTRILEKSILEANGYLVDIAVDGMEALNYLESTLVDLIISDVEMPRLDGLGLLQRVKATPRLAHIPVIMVSSLDQQEHRQRGLTLGADAYLPKQGFNQDVLLDTIKQVI